MTEFRFATDVGVRYRDLDPMGHVNHAVYASYMERARIDYLDEVLDVPVEEISSVLAHIEIDYRRALTYEDDPTVAVRTSDLGESSITMAYEVRSDGDVVATGETVMVRVDEEKSAAPIPHAWRERVRAYEGEAVATGD